MRQVEQPEQRPKLSFVQIHDIDFSRKDRPRHNPFRDGTILAVGVLVMILDLLIIPGTFLDPSLSPNIFAMGRLPANPAGLILHLGFWRHTLGVLECTVSVPIVFSCQRKTVMRIDLAAAQLPQGAGRRAHFLKIGVFADASCFIDTQTG